MLDYLDAHGKRALLPIALTFDPSRPDAILTRACELDKVCKQNAHKQGDF
jgi:hypothetical protein